MHSEQGCMAQRREQSKQPNWYEHHTYFTLKPWELQPDAFLSEENSQALRCSIYCQL